MVKTIPRGKNPFRSMVLMPEGARRLVERLTQVERRLRPAENVFYRFSMENADSHWITDTSADIRPVKCSGCVPY